MGKKAVSVLLMMFWKNTTPLMPPNTKAELFIRTSRNETTLRSLEVS